jgi:ribosome-binding ATPase YchF (GTP1/OBG family)
LLELLADELAAEDFRLRDFLRQLTLSQTYQRSCEPAAPETLNFVDIEARRAALQQHQPTLEKEVSKQQAAATDARQLWQASVATNAEVLPALTKSEQELAAAQQSEAEARAAHTQAEQLHKQHQQQLETLEPVLIAARAAQKQLPEEAALQESLTILGKRADELSAGVEAAANQLEQAKGALAMILWNRARCGPSALVRPRKTPGCSGLK